MSPPPVAAKLNAVFSDGQTKVKVKHFPSTTAGHGKPKNDFGHLPSLNPPMFIAINTFVTQATGDRAVWERFISTSASPVGRRTTKRRVTLYEYIDTVSQNKASHILW